jgi:hypothetical protein
MRQRAAIFHPPDSSQQLLKRALFRRRIRSSTAARGGAGSTLRMPRRQTLREHRARCPICAKLPPNSWHFGLIETQVMH